MSYFSNLSVSILELQGPVDKSYPSPKEQLLWRYEDLLARREELLACGSSGSSGLLIDDICYTLPEHLCSLGDVETAIELAEDDLKRKNHVVVTASECGKTAKSPGSLSRGCVKKSV